MTEESRIQAYVKAYIDCDVADCDYVSARMFYRFELPSQFLWSSLQCLEKYLKAILLYDGKKTKKLGHDILRAFRRVVQTSDIEFGLPDDTEEFMAFLSHYGTDRYLDKSFYMEGNELLRLDETVWHLRRHCYSRCDEQRKMATCVTLRGKSPAHKAEAVNTVRIWGGKLEKILDDRNSKLREHLVWKNFWYGAKKKRTIKNYKFNSCTVLPMHYIRKEVYYRLRGIAHFSKQTRAHFEDITE